MLGMVRVLTGKRKGRNSRVEHLPDIFRRFPITVNFQIREFRRLEIKN